MKKINANIYFIFIHAIHIEQTTYLTEEKIIGKHFNWWTVCRDFLLNLELFKFWRLNFVEGLLQFFCILKYIVKVVFFQKCYFLLLQVYFEITCLLSGWQFSEVFYGMRVRVRARKMERRAFAFCLSSG